MKPDTERKRVSWVNLGTDLGVTNIGAAANAVRPPARTLTVQKDDSPVMKMLAR